MIFGIQIFSFLHLIQVFKIYTDIFSETLSTVDNANYLCCQPSFTQELFVLFSNWLKKELVNYAKSLWFTSHGCSLISLNEHAEILNEPINKIELGLSVSVGIV